MKYLCDCRKVQDIANRNRYWEGEMIYVKQDSLSILNQSGEQDQSYNLDMALFTNNLRPLEHQQKLKIVDTDKKIEANT